MKSIILLCFILLSTSVAAEFILEKVEVVVSEIAPDGSAKVKESIKLMIRGKDSQALYDSGYGGYSSNDLSFWSSTTGLKDIKRHVNPPNGEITEFTLIPQPRKKCNPIQEICHGELILEYRVLPAFKKDRNPNIPIEETGLFTVDNYKPRTTRYSLNTRALSFTRTEQGNILLEKNIHLTIKLPEGTTVTKLNPFPEGIESELPASFRELTWSDMVLVRFILEFESEESLGKEVIDFFADFVRYIINGINGPYGSAIITIAIILVGGYLYIQKAKRKR